MGEKRGSEKRINVYTQYFTMVTKTINIKESAYHALKAHKRAGESYSDVILRVTAGEEKSVCDFLQTVDPAVRSEIAESVISAKSELDRIKPRKVLL
jgi:predicted CopG family antitoxin